MMERVVVTGLGTLNATAKSAPGFAQALREGRCGIGPFSVFDPSTFRTQIAAEVKDFNPRDHIPRPYPIKRMSRADLLGFAATLEALQDAGLAPFPPELAEETGVVIGGGGGGLLEGERFYGEYLRTEGRLARFSALSAVYCASSADRIAALLGLWGPKTTFMTACSSGATAIGYARDLIRGGTAPVVIAGGTEPLCRITYAAFNALQAVDLEPCKPFAGNRAGLSLGEAAGILVLESLRHARARGARIYAEVLGYGVTCDSHHMTAPDPEASGAVRSMREALRDAGVSAERVDYVNAHGTATPANDAMESRAIRHVFGDRAGRIPVSSTKSMTGHTLGASGALEAVASVLAIRHRFIPPTIHCTVPDPECDLDYVTEGAREADLSVILSNSFAFGGNNTSLVIGRFDGGKG
ncbi:MAG: beta-ketoacyl-[acyl-carrier-protein] synthase family protein [Deltaproteobacteria bacterium HGW-Deltaproteobacteria-19]|jgi:3-oxoacyl-[acyl-carrier-protein] synthase II|nr:MAG: beta-ketoacyl-[acyl-carrier-protein] synthase family protein [Deltaproteobacteria bacterium HGW-Deltaproteobacteria-19]